MRWLCRIRRWLGNIGRFGTGYWRWIFGRGIGKGGSCCKRKREDQYGIFYQEDDQLTASSSGENRVSSGRSGCASSSSGSILYASVKIGSIDESEGGSFIMMIVVNSTFLQRPFSDLST
jgi:hypothetical protein